MAALKVTQVKSGIGAKPKARGTLRARSDRFRPVRPNRPISRIPATISSGSISR